MFYSFTRCVNAIDNRRLKSLTKFKISFSPTPKQINSDFIAHEVNRDETGGGCRKVHIEGLHNLYSLLNIIRMIMSRRMRGVGYAARMGEKVNAYEVLVGKPEREHKEYLEVDREY
jgi:hypothetical protein